MKHAIWFCLFFLIGPFSWATDILLEGDAIQGGMMFGHAPAGTHVWLDDVDITVASDGRFVFGFGRDNKPRMVLKATLPDGTQWQQRLEIVQREYRIQRVEGISNAIISKQKPPEVWERIQQEVALVKKARRNFFRTHHYADDFEWPLKGPITGVFGSQRVYNGEPGRPHYGLDIAAPVGTLVAAPAAGVVTMVHPDMYYSGGTVIIDHGMGISSSFLHLSEVLVKVGDTIKQGQTIAKVGSGGRSSGPHLDWRMNWFDQRLDPQLLMVPQNAE